MKSANKIQINIGSFFLLFVLSVTVLFLSPVNTAYASEVSTTDLQESQTTDVTTADSGSAVTDDQGLVLGEGYYVDDQGNTYYDESLITVDEPVIEDTADTEDDTEDVSTDADELNAEDVTKTVTKDKATTESDKSTETTTTEKKPTYTQQELRLLSCLVYAEAGNQSYGGMLAVANVVLNRVDSDVFWHVNTIKEVIYDHKWAVQFSVTIKSSKTGLSALDKALKAYDSGKFIGANPTAEKKAMAKATKAAKAALEGKNNIGSYLCFTNKREASSIKRRYSDYKIIGDHIFYRTK